MDTQPVFRSGIRAALCAQDGMVVLGECGSVDGLVSGIVSLKPNVVVVDGALLDRPTLVRLNDTCNALDAHVLVIAPAWSATFVALLNDGLVRSCVLRATDKAAFVDAVRLVGSGERVLNKDIEVYLTRPEPGSLTVRELSVLALAAEGYSNTAIAGELRISLSYVNAQMRRVLQKLHARDRTQAVISGLRYGLLDIG